MIARHRMSDQEWREHWEGIWRDARHAAAGRWESILAAKAPQLIPAMNTKGKRHVPCPNPNHQDSKDGFRVFKDFHETGGGVCNTCGTFQNGFALLQWANGWSAREALDEVTSYLNGSAGKLDRRTPLAAPVKPKNEPDNESLRRSLNRVWINSIPIDHRDAEPGRRYISRRGISIDAFPNLMFHRSLMYHDGDKVVGYFPALVALVQSPTGQPVTIHRTYLTEDGRKADVESPKKLMSYPDDRKIMGSAIRLCKPGRVLAVAEGIETAWAVWRGTGIPAWATVNAVMLENFVPPEGVEQLIVFGDKDRPSKMHAAGHGQEAAKALVVRAWKMGIKATAIMPAGEIPEGEKSLDWLDILRRDGLSGFPSLESVRRSMLRAA